MADFEDNTTNDKKLKDFLNMLSDKENDENYNLFGEKISKEYQKRHDAVIGTEFWGRKKRNMSRCER